MNWEDIISKILAIIVIALIAYIEPKVKQWLDEKIGAKQTEEILKLVKMLVQSAEQIYKDETGEFRKSYVKQSLQAMGLEVDEEINAMIESEVYSMNQKKERL